MYRETENYACHEFFGFMVCSKMVLRIPKVHPNIMSGVAKAKSSGATHTQTNTLWAKTKPLKINDAWCFYFRFKRWNERASGGKRVSQQPFRIKYSGWNFEELITVSSPTNNIKIARISWWFCGVGNGFAFFLLHSMVRFCSWSVIAPSFRSLSHFYSFRFFYDVLYSEAKQKRWGKNYIRRLIVAWFHRSWFSFYLLLSFALKSITLSSLFLCIEHSVCVSRHATPCHATSSNFFTLWSKYNESQTNRSAIAFIYRIHRIYISICIRALIVCVLSLNAQVRSWYYYTEFPQQQREKKPLRETTAV